MAENSNAEQVLNIEIQGMTCASCVGRVERVIKRLDHVSDVNINLATETATIKAGKDLSIPELSQAIAKTGFKWKRSLRWAMYYVIIFVIFLFAGTEQQFIYFQF